MLAWRQRRGLVTGGVGYKVLLRWVLIARPRVLAVGGDLRLEETCA